jgi:hypothetical protein
MDQLKIRKPLQEKYKEQMKDIASTMKKYLSEYKISE